MLKREFNAGRINAVVNHPDVRRWVAPMLDRLDLAPLVKDKRNILLMAGEGGGFLYHWRGAKTYEVHTQFLPEHRAGVFHLADESLRWIFAHTDADAVLTRVPAHNRAADVLTRAMKFDLVSVDPQAWVTPDGRYDLKHFRLTRRKWKATRG